MSAIGTTYSFKDLVGVLDSPLLGTPLQLVGGNIGLGTLTIKMLTQRTEFDTGADGSVMPSYVAGDSGECTLEVQQTSALHHALIALSNAINTANNAGDLTNAFSMSIHFRTILDGSSHQLNAVGFQKVPDKPYGAKGQMVTWVLMATQVINQ